MGKYDNLEGMQFSRLLVQEKTERKNGHQFYRCRCTCGEIVTVSGSALVQGKAKSCGCLRKEKAKVHAEALNRNEVSVKHGDYSSRLYRIWVGMKRRCYNECCDHYDNYGGRGITVCEDWRDNYQQFKTWALANGYSDELTLDRIDSNKDYSPDNCRWATRKTQANNTRSNVRVEYHGENRTITEWSQITGIPDSTIQSRLSKGYPLEDVFSKSRFNRWNKPSGGEK